MTRTSCAINQKTLCSCLPERADANLTRTRHRGESINPEARGPLLPELLCKTIFPGRIACTEYRVAGLLGHGTKLAMPLQRAKMQTGTSDVGCRSFIFTLSMTACKY